MKDVTNDRSVSFAAWTQNRDLASMGTNAGSTAVAFQEWRHFKEAFTPELIAHAVAESEIPVRRCIDPFGGSGTTALACQFLGVAPTTVEVNPYLADLIEAKLTPYDADAIISDLGSVLRRAIRSRNVSRLRSSADAPPTLVEPGVGGRWIFDRPIASRIGALQQAISVLKNRAHQRLFRVLLGSILLDVSNVVVNGKGRRYRRRWQERRRNADDVERLFSDRVRSAANDAHRFGQRKLLRHTVIRGDARDVQLTERFDLSVFSPPYPNSFDYTDVYNLELWALGYLQSSAENRHLRTSTLTSHVQIHREFSPRPHGSRTLSRVFNRLCAERGRLWDPHIPEMVGAYFSDLLTVLKRVGARLHRRGQIWAVVGDSRYADVHIPTAKIIGQLAPTVALRVISIEPFRSMRSSAQQGGDENLSESLIRLTRS